MTAGLRKSHIIIWMVILVFMSVLIVSSIAGVPVYPIQESIKEKTTLSGTVLKSVKNEFSTLSLKEIDSRYLLEVNLTEPLKASSTALYELNKEGNKGTFIGQIGETGNYMFPSSKELKGVILFDIIKETELAKITF